MDTAATRTDGTNKKWRFAIWLILAAFTLQSYVVQTHFHDVSLVAIGKAFTSTSHGKSPVDNSPLDCPFCQAAMSGVFALFVTPLVFLFATGRLFAALDHPAAASYDTIAHIWRSRGPPQ